jgi:hypothetical protein
VAFLLAPGAGAILGAFLGYLLFHDMNCFPLSEGEPASDSYYIEEATISAEGGGRHACTNVVSLAFDRPRNPSNEEAAAIGGVVGVLVGLVLTGIFGVIVLFISQFLKKNA